jgi:hypothetical protein
MIPEDARMSKAWTLILLAVVSTVYASESELYGIITDSRGRPVMAEIKLTDRANHERSRIITSDKHGVYTIKLDHPGEWKLDIGGRSEIVQSYANPTRWDIKLK